MSYDVGKYFRPEMGDIVFGGLLYTEVDGVGEPLCMVVGPDIYAGMNWDSKKGYSIPDCWLMKYLDGDDIESYGFFRLQSAPFDYRMTGNVKLQWFQRDQYVLSFAPETRMLGIYVYTDDNYGIYFSGVCRDVNRFRLLISMVTQKEEKFLTFDNSHLLTYK